MTELSRLDANLLVAFDAILAERNLTRAGERLGMTQTAVSGALTRLRKLFDDPLLVRSGRTMSLTARAEEMRPLVRDALTEIDRTFGALVRFDPSTSERVFSIMASDYALSVLISPLLTVLATEAPRVAVTFEALPVDPVSTGPDLQRHDVVVAAAGSLSGPRRTLFTDEFVCIVSADNPRLTDGALTIDDLRQLGHVTVTFGAATSTPADHALSEAGIVPHRTIGTRGFLVAPFLVSGTDLVALVPGRLAASVPPGLRLVVARTTLPRAELVEAAHWNPSSTADPAVRWLLGILQELGAGLDSEAAAAPDADR